VNLDLVGGDVQTNAWSALRVGGILISTVGHPSQERTTDAGARGVFFIVSPNGSELARIGELIDTGKVRSKIQRVLPLGDAKAAF
jgi:NADPH:quinone reductase-like Zn-dependent oxidoreductase